MKTEDAYLVGIHRSLYRAGEPAKIIGVVVVTPSEDLDPRPCFHIQWGDKEEDWRIIDKDVSTYEIITLKDIIDGNIPKVID